MAVSCTDKKFLLKSIQNQTQTCEKHDLPIDIICEDCDEFICSQCTKSDHMYHDWNTISTAGRLKKRELRETLRKIKEEDVLKIEEKIRNASKLMEDNQKCCNSDMSKLQKHNNAIVSNLDEIKKNIETMFVEILRRKNANVKGENSDLEKKKKHIMDLVKFLEEKHGTMSDYSLIDNLRDFTSLVSNTDIDKDKMDHSLRYRRGDISEGSLESMMGQTFNLDAINVTERDSFQNGDNSIFLTQAENEDTCFVRDNSESEYIERIDIKNKKREKFNMNVQGVDVTDNGDVFATDYINNSIVRLSPSGSVSKVFSTDPLVPGGICQSIKGGLLVTLIDTQSEPYQLDSHSRRLVRHLKLTGDVIREYEYQEDGKTRLFTLPWRVRQNGNNDICVVNWTSHTSSELVILSLSGSLKTVYRGQDMKNCFLSDVLCDSHCNIIVCERFYSQIHLLSSYGEFMKHLITETEVRDPMSMSLYKSTLWVGDKHGLVKVFQYKL